MRCNDCDYDLNSHGVGDNCPECGAAVESSIGPRIPLALWVSAAIVLIPVVFLPLALISLLPFPVESTSVPLRLLVAACASLILVVAALTRWHPRRWSCRKALTLASVLGLTSLVGHFAAIDLGIGMESRCWLWPSIDTNYAPGYSDAAFQMLQPGMTPSQVDQVMRCRPLAVYSRGPNQVRWSYTADGRCTWNDFAWKGRHVTFTDGLVSAVTAKWYYD